jgi:hypothetical protein
MILNRTEEKHTIKMGEPTSLWPPMDSANSADLFHAVPIITLKDLDPVPKHYIETSSILRFEEFADFISDDPWLKSQEIDSSRVQTGPLRRGFHRALTVAWLPM